MERFIEYTTHKNKHVIYKDLTKSIDVVDAYLIGNLGYDGTFNRRNGNIIIETTDPYILELARQYWSPTLEINSRGLRSSTKVTAVSEGFRAYLPAPMCRDISKFGIARLKSDRGFYGIPKALRPACLAGAVDAEGWWTVRHRKDCRYPKLNFGINSSAKLLNRHVQAWLHEVGIPSRIYEKDVMSELRIEHLDSAVKFGLYIYSIVPPGYNSKKLSVFNNYYQNVYLPLNRVNCGEAQTIRSQASSEEGSETR